jgi:hypothetical protein
MGVRGAVIRIGKMGGVEQSGEQERKDEVERQEMIGEPVTLCGNSCKKGHYRDLKLKERTSRSPPRHATRAYSGIARLERCVDG